MSNKNKASNNQSIRSSKIAVRGGSYTAGRGIVRNNDKKRLTNAKSKYDRVNLEKFIEKSKPDIPVIKSQNLSKSPILERTWSLWVNKVIGFGASTTSSPVIKAYTYNSIEGFWSMFNNLPGPSNLPIGYNLYLFVDPISPTWEDAANSKGGRWFLSSSEDMTDAWMKICLAVMGETMKNSDSVLGFHLSRRQKYSRIAIWVKDKNATAIVKSIGQQSKQIVGTSNPFEFQEHGDSYGKYKFVIN
jgi:translation initiation factor 4E